MLRLPARAAVMYNQTLGGPFCEFTPMIALEQAQRQIRPRRHSRRGPDRSVGDKDAIDFHARIGKAALKFTREAPVGRGSALMQEGRITENEGTKGRRRQAV